jgi:thiol-disulfide isomerase/thioredoxin
LPDTTNKLFDTTILKGKWYLIDFWASWCGPCRQQLPELKRVYEVNKSKDFEIVGISIDERKGDWIKALDKEQLYWINIIENKGFVG